MQVEFLSYRSLIVFKLDIFSILTEQFQLFGIGYFSALNGDIFKRNILDYMICIIPIDHGKGELSIHDLDISKVDISNVTPVGGVKHLFARQDRQQVVPSIFVSMFFDHVRV